MNPEKKCRCENPQIENNMCIAYCRICKLPIFEEYKTPCRFLICKEHKYHCAKCNTALSCSPANYASRLEDIVNPCNFCFTLFTIPKEEEILYYCVRCGGKFLPVGKVLEYGKSYPEYRMKINKDGVTTEKNIPAFKEIKKALCRECAKDVYDEENPAPTPPLAEWAEEFNRVFHSKLIAPEYKDILRNFIKEVEERAREEGYEEGKTLVLRHPLFLTDKNSIDIEKTLEVARKEERAKVRQIIEEYFKGLIVIPDPQATKENLLSKLLKENNERT